MLASPATPTLLVMSRHFQALSAALLLVLVPVFGQAGFLQCLCSGQFTSPTFAVEVNQAHCCEQTPDRTECCHDDGNDEAPSPCDDGSCWVLITLDAVEVSAKQVPCIAPLAIWPPAFALPTLAGSPVALKLAFPQQRPPDRLAVPATVLFSSFLI